MSCSSAFSPRRSIASSAARASALALAAALLLGGCATGPPLSAPADPIPDLRGTWRGTWGGTPLTLLVLDQNGTVTPGGIAFGPWPLTGESLPGLDGVLTFEVRGRPVSVNVRGRFGDWNGRLTLVVDGLTNNGEQLVLTHLAEDRLAGSGTSLPDWQPQGPVELRRATVSNRR